MNSRNTVSVIIHDKESDTIAAVLYVARSWSLQPTWPLPSGKAEPGEPLDEAAARELKSSREPVKFGAMSMISAASGSWAVHGGHGSCVTDRRQS
ncbi:NUDIX domain-containing protein [Streptomyces sp. NPDC088757]|uniref:NUDIX domain-containing protein n=1 Tax=Streptomyces sp. NPDC088757 TaxID=3365889 RepID=UPI003817CDE4